jgi:hypothetical protein
MQPTTNSRVRAATGLLETALWFALITAAAHLAWLLGRAVVLHHVVSAGIDLVWMTPASYVLLFLPVGILGAMILASMREVLARMPPGYQPARP